MSNFQICLCGAQPGYPHAADCPRPLFGSFELSNPQLIQWEAERAALKSERIFLTFLPPEPSPQKPTP